MFTVRNEELMGFRNEHVTLHTILGQLGNIMYLLNNLNVLML